AADEEAGASPARLRHCAPSTNPGSRRKSDLRRGLVTATRDASSRRRAHMSTTAFPIQETTPITVPVTVGARWMIGAVMVALLVYYFIGVDRGPVSVCGHNMYIHEFVPAARHLLGFPCH